MGEVIDDGQEIRNQIFQFFKSRWTEQGEPSSGGWFPEAEQRVSVEDNEALTRPMMEEEIRRAVWELGADKAPGPDGFPPFFFRQYWPIVGREVVAAVQHVFGVGGIPGDWKKTFITLVPKRPDAVSPEHFRPISLCSTLYKVCAKILVGRMKPVVPRLICPEQGAFISGRYITDNTLLAQEMMHDLQHASPSHCLMAIKLDMERAYDRISWRFLWHTLRSFGFCSMWIDWIRDCVENSLFAILVNGSPTDFFQSKVGLRQGCPLSPFLFVLCADALSRALRMAAREGDLQPYWPAPRFPLTHLLFADDCLVMGHASACNAASFMAVIEDYCRASGQRINRAKSSVMLSPKTQTHEMYDIHETLGIGDRPGPMMYLGIPLMGRRPRVAECKFMVQRIRDRVEGWQVGTLSMMGRVTLIRTVLSAIPMYLMSNTVVPISCLREMERIFRDFLWGSLRDNHGTHLLPWDVVCSPLDEGGLGIQPLTQRRDVMFARHAARFLLHPDCLWSRVMRARYGCWSRDSDVQVDHRASFLWKEVCRVAPLILPRVRWLIGDGSAVDISRDAWISSLPISMWPTFVSTGIADHCSVSDLIEEGGGWRVEEVASLFGGPLVDRIIQLPTSACRSGDTRVWGESCLPTAPVRDLSRLLYPRPLSQVDAAWIWKLQAHPRVRIFLWKLVWDRLPTCSLLHRRGVLPSSLCVICGLEVETSDHAVFACPRARLIWQSLGLCPWERGAGLRRLAFLDCIRQNARSRCGGLGDVIALYIAYMIWISRNHFIFAGKVTPSHQVLRRAQFLAYEFARYDAHQQLPSGTWDSPAASAAIRRTVFISWESPPPGFLKLNFDGSVRGAVGGAGYVIRDQGGRLLAAGGSKLTEVSVPFSELYAAWAGTLTAIRGLGARRIVIEGDSMTVIDWIRQGVHANPLLKDIDCLIRSLDAVVVHHVFREANCAADWTATFVTHYSGTWLWRPGDTCPQGLDAILFSDSLGLTHTRVV